MEIGELFAEKGEPPRYDRSASDNRGSRISPRLVPRPGDVSSGSNCELRTSNRQVCLAFENGHPQGQSACLLGATSGPMHRSK